MAVKKYNKRPPSIEAIQLTKETREEVLEWIEGGYISDEWDSKNPDEIVINIKGTSGKFSIKNGDYVLKGDMPGDYYPCDKEVFESTFMEIV